MTELMAQCNVSKLKEDSNYESLFNLVITLCKDK